MKEKPKKCLMNFAHLLLITKLNIDCFERGCAALPKVALYVARLNLGFERLVRG